MDGPFSLCSVLGFSVSSSVLVQVTHTPSHCRSGVSNSFSSRGHIQPNLMQWWSRPDLDPMFVYLWRARQDNTYMKNPMYTGRTSLSVDELKKGNMSLKLTNVQLSDRGTYTCLFLANNLEMSVELIVAPATSSKPVVKLVGIGKPSGSVVLECMSSGWYPEPEVSWMDSEGHLVSTGPPETVRGPDDLYTVSSRVTVDKRHGSTVTCRVHQDRTNQTRQTWIRVSGRNHNMVCLVLTRVPGTDIKPYLFQIALVLWCFSPMEPTRRKLREEKDLKKSKS
uniref:Ig-like domain-containing protein n=1 Tax=Sphaeramia orbicularis TaxID=375764 RepID=A0A672Z9V4_9TELE